MLGFHCVGIQLWVVSCWQSENWSGEGVIGQLEVGFDMQSVYGRLSCGHILGNPGRLNRRGSTVWVELGYHPFCRQGRLAGNVPWGWRWCGQGVWSWEWLPSLEKGPKYEGFHSQVDCKRDILLSCREIVSYIFDILEKLLPVSLVDGRLKCLRTFASSNWWTLVKTHSQGWQRIK